jgi:hypothetical protein
VHRQIATVVGGPVDGVVEWCQRDVAAGLDEGSDRELLTFLFTRLRAQLLQSINCLLEDGPERKRSSRSKAVSAIVVKRKQLWNTQRAAHLCLTEERLWLFSQWLKWGRAMKLTFSSLLVSMLLRSPVFLSRLCLPLTGECQQQRTTPLKRVVGGNAGEASAKRGRYGFKVSAR